MCQIYNLCKDFTEWENITASTDKMEVQNGDKKIVACIVDES